MQEIHSRKACENQRTSSRLKSSTDISGSMSGNPITQVYRLAFPYNLVSVQHVVPFCTRHQNDIQYIKGYL